MTKSSMTSAKTSTALAKIAGDQHRQQDPAHRADRRARRGPTAASSYCLPIVSSRARTMTTG